MVKRRVIGFDSWTEGAHHLERLVDAFARKGLDVTLIHLGSWGNDIRRPTTEVIGRLGVRDISFYGRRRLAEVLDLEKPCAVIFLSMHAFGHRAINRYCNYRNIPTVHLFHGLYGATNEDDAVSVMPHKRLWLLRHHIRKLLQHFIPVYARSLWETDAGMAEWQQFRHDIVNRFLGRNIGEATADSRADIACVYIDSEIARAVAKHGYAKTDVVPVGNPDLSDFDMAPENIGHFLRSDFTPGIDVMYIDSGLVDVGLVYESQDEFIRHILHTRDELARQGRHLVFKSHPVHSRSRVLTEVTSAGVDICSVRDFVSKLEKCCACIVEPSSVALIPALMGVPLLLAQYGKLGSRRFGELLTTYPRTKPLVDLREFPSLLLAEQADLDPARTMAWINNNTGPLPSDALPDRVADVVLSLLDRRVEQVAAHKCGHDY